MARNATLAAIGVLLLTGAGCGGDDDGGYGAPPPADTTSTQAEAPQRSIESAPQKPAPSKPRRERTPASVASCVRDAPGAGDVLVKAKDSEDVTFFTDLAGSRVDVIGMTLKGEEMEITIALFASPADAKKAAPQAGGGMDGLTTAVHGSAVVVAPANARTGPIEGCLHDTGYAG